MDYIIAQKLKDLRKNNNISQEKLAEKLNISRSKVSSWENNKRDMTVTDAINLAEFYGISLDALLNNECISESEYIRISCRFFKDKKLKLKEKIVIIKTIEESIKNNNVDELYEFYKMTQNETK